MYAVSRQINMDYSICKALSYNMGEIPVALVMYDIMCQYRVHFKERVMNIPELFLNKGTPDGYWPISHPWPPGFLLAQVFTKLHSRSKAG